MVIGNNPNKTSTSKLKIFSSCQSFLKTKKIVFHGHSYVHIIFMMFRLRIFIHFSVCVLVYVLVFLWRDAKKAPPEKFQPGLINWTDDLSRVLEGHKTGPGWSKV